ncbi:MAG: sugar ABC transporter permease [Anaerolineae bacterium]|nr:sugar ABC transporter permease [Anaerolineae bacterium]
MALPWLIGFLLFTAGPITAALLLGFTEWDIISPPKFVGLENWVSIFTEDELFRKSAVVTLTYAAMAVPLHVILGFVLASLLNSKVPGTNTFRAIYYLPTVLPLVATAVLWSWVLNPEFGLVNYMLSLIGVQGPGWLTDENWSLPSIVLMNLNFIGITVVIMLAGLQRVPQEMYEAAQLDGANRRQILRYVTIPFMSPVIFFTIILNLNNSFQTFTQAYVMTNGGPGTSTLFYMLYLFNNAFRYFKMGYANALALVLFLTIITITITQFRLSRLWVYSD